MSSAFVGGLGDADLQFDEVLGEQRRDEIESDKIANKGTKSASSKLEKPRNPIPAEEAYHFSKGK